jgi:hypothetical protein
VVVEVKVVHYAVAAVGRTRDVMSHRNYVEEHVGFGHICGVLQDDGLAL